ncbi:MAG: PDZ domain-containing protein [Proteobacteria bacterium]|nr:PDZ domain-containing protein [Pseudomonadota bacterium]
MEMVKINKTKVIDIIGFITVILFLSYYLGNIIKLATLKETLPESQKKQEPQKNTSKTINDYALVVDKNIFSIKGATFSVIEKKAEQSVAVDSTGLKLKGVITLFPGYAFIENKEGKQILFKLGDDVFNTGKLSMVTKDYVYISQGGRGFKVPLEGAVLEDKKTSSGNPPNLSSQTQQAPGQGQTFSRDLIKRFLEEPREILTDARLLPNIVDGKQQGFVVREVKPNGFYDSIGLKNGDVILRANGIELTSPNDGIKIFNLLKELDKVELDIMRDGVRKSLVYYIN